MKTIENPTIRPFRLAVIPYILLMVYCVTVGEYPAWAIAVGAASLLAFLVGVGYNCVRQKCYGQMAAAYGIVLGFTALFWLLNFYMAHHAVQKPVNENFYQLGSTLLDISLGVYMVSLFVILIVVSYYRRQNNSTVLTPEQKSKVKKLSVTAAIIAIALTVASIAFLILS